MMNEEDDIQDQILERKVSFLLPKSPSNPSYPDEVKTDFSTLLSEKESKISVTENNFSHGMIIENIPTKKSL